VAFEFLQPLPVSFRYEDEHVIAYFDGHPEYEAVEAFVAHRHGRAALIRAVLTRHDKSQVDHLNDAALLAAYRRANPLREAVFAEIDYTNIPGEPGPRLHLDFVSCRDEPIAVDLYAVGVAAAEFGGLTDPEGHAPDVLPILWRDASTMASRRSTLAIAGTPYDIPIFLEVGDLVGLRAFFTAGLAVGIVSTGADVLACLEAPEALVAGACWRYRRGDAEVVYEVVEIDGERVRIRRTSGIPETIEACLRSGRLTVAAIRTASGSDHPGEHILTFDPSLPEGPWDAAGTFAVAVDDQADLVTGRVEPTPSGFALLPDEPSWARRRVVRVDVARTAETVMIGTSVGP
jgi:hypothetical protein